MVESELGDDVETVLQALQFTLKFFQKKEFYVKEMDNIQMEIFLNTIAGTIAGMGDIIKTKDKDMYQTLTTALEQLALR